MADAYRQPLRRIRPTDGEHSPRKGTYPFEVLTSEVASLRSVRLRAVVGSCKDIEQSRGELISHYASLVPQALSELSSKEKNRVFQMMHLQVFAHRDGTLIADWGCNVLPQPRWSSEFTTPTFRFRAVLAGDGGEEVEVARDQKG